MNSDELERILQDEPTITVSPDFSARVMREVLLDASRAATRRSRTFGLGRMWLTATGLALASAFASHELHTLAASTPRIGSELAPWLVLIVPASLAFGCWSSRLFDAL